MMRHLLFASCAWALCGSGMAQAQVKLEWKFAPNTHVTTVDVLNLTAKVQINGQNVEIGGDTRMTRKHEFLVPAESLSPVKISLAAAAVSARADGQNFTFDSAIPAAKSGNPEFDKEVETLQALIGNALTYQLAADGKVSRVEGIQAAISKAPAEAAKGLEEQLQEQRLKDQFEQQIRLVPDTPVNVGDTWKRLEQVPVQGGSTLAVDREYKYVGPVIKDGRSVDHIGVKDESVTIVLGQNNIGLTLKESALKIDTSEGTMYFDRELDLKPA